MQSFFYRHPHHISHLHLHLDLHLHPHPHPYRIQHLFHSSVSFDIATLGVFMIIYYLLSCWTYGVAVPSGLFVPNLLAGAAFGRMIGEALDLYTPLTVVDAGTYALIGAAAILGGMAR